MDTLRKVKVLKAGLMVDEKPIPIGTLFSAVEVYDEKEIPYYFLLSESQGRGTIRKIILIAFAEIGIVEFFNDECSSVEANSSEEFSCPDVVNLSPISGENAFF